MDRELFEAVQAKLAAGANARQLKLRASPSILAGRLFDDRGNRMTPTHTNKRGARYRYYVSHPILQKRNNEAGTVSRVSANFGRPTSGIGLAAISSEVYRKVHSTFQVDQHR